MSSNQPKPKMTSIFRVQVLFLLKTDNPKTGYDLAKELELMIGKKPSSGKLYPFLHMLRDGRYIKVVDEDIESDRNRSKYMLTLKGGKLKEEIFNRMENLLSIRLEQLLDQCFHCGVKLYESKVEGKDSEGNSVVFCCPHCMSAYLE